MSTLLNYQSCESKLLIVKQFRNYNIIMINGRDQEPTYRNKYQYLAFTVVGSKLSPNISIGKFSIGNSLLH